MPSVKSLVGMMERAKNSLNKDNVVLVLGLEGVSKISIVARNERVKALLPLNR